MPRPTGFSPIHGKGGAMVKKNKAWSMPAECWQWLESQDNQSEVLRIMFDVQKALAIPSDLTGFSDDDRQTHDAMVLSLREKLTEYAAHCAKLSPYEKPVDDVVLILAAALGKDRLPELIDAVASASYKLDAADMAASVTLSTASIANGQSAG